METPLFGAIDFPRSKDITRTRSFDTLCEIENTLSVSFAKRIERSIITLLRLVRISLAIKRWTLLTEKHPLHSFVEHSKYMGCDNVCVYNAIHQLRSHISGHSSDITRKRISFAWAPHVNCNPLPYLISQNLNADIGSRPRDPYEWFLKDTS